jgi:DeoR/GlpR family transcriptional regulator of sugar metabolism
VSDETIRRDLDELAQQGLVVRTRGGAIAPGNLLIEHPHRVRQLENPREKQAIARAVAEQLVTPGMALALDTGSTSLEVARALRSQEVTVVTNSLPITTDLLGSSCTVVIVGGMARAKSLSVTGPVAERSTESFRFDLALISAPAIAADVGLMDTDLEEIEIKRRFIARATRAYAILDHTKLGRSAFSAICAISELTGLVTDDGADPDILETFRAAGLEVIVGERTT